ncbi:MAG: hypothetical protein BWX80_00470 [Candidatus Hydrogenedentes bacterium ADurb.Bin101]|nr:MAG: hypothetical protein BWX80_00470 [Candidatus Hydrogenedentes bacterium ADurb.Bin101]
MIEQMELFPEEQIPVEGPSETRPSNRAFGPTAREMAPPKVSNRRQEEPAKVEERDIKKLVEALRLELEGAAKCRVSLVITNNTSNMMSIRLEQGANRACVRLHHMFVDAPDEVRTALAYLVKHPKSRKYAACIRNFIASRKHQIRSSHRAPAKLQPRGVVYDLRDIYDELNAVYFHGKVNAAITWGRDIASSGRSIRFGSYYEATNLIRIHKRLDQTFVPLFVIRYIVFHEMLHASLGVGKDETGRRQIHSGKFKKLERDYPEYTPAVDWIENQDNLNRLLRVRKTRHP